MKAWIDRIAGSLYLSRIQANGKRKRRKVAADTPEGREEAEKLLVALNRSLARDAFMGTSDVPTLAEMAKRYLLEDVGHLAKTTRGDRPGYLREGGLLLEPLGHYRLDQITVPVLREWWGRCIDGKLARQTGRHYADVLQSVYGYAIELEIVATSPVPGLRAILRRHSRTQAGRAETDASKHVRPLSLGDAAKLVAAAARESKQDLVLVLLGLDAGFRAGEALGLRWGGVVPGDDANDTRRCLELDDESNKPRGGQAGPPKSGRVRSVHASRRLLVAISALRLERFGPAPAQTVVADVDPHNWRRREWRRICARSGLPGIRFKDLRDTFASQLLTAGVQLGYLADQLGHADVSVTAKHYARWCGGKEYRAPVPLLPGEVPADLLARLPIVEHPDGAMTGGFGATRTAGLKVIALAESAPVRPSEFVQLAVAPPTPVATGNPAT